MPEFEFSQTAQQWVNVVLIWVGFGALAGLLARCVLPMGRRCGSVATMVCGIVGSVIGLFVLSHLPGGKGLNPISPLGFLASATAAFVLILLHRIAVALFDRAEES